MPTMTAAVSSSEHTSVASGSIISKGTEILCFASIIPALAIIFYVSSRIIRGGSTKKKIEQMDNSINRTTEYRKIQSPAVPDIEDAILKHPEASHQAKKESRIQDLRRYLGSPPSDPSQSLAAYKPFANHRCSISIKDFASSKARLSLRPLSFLSVIKKRHAKTKPPTGDQPDPYVTHSSHGFSDTNRRASIRLWRIADAVVGAHPRAEPLHARLPVHGGALYSGDSRLLSDNGLGIPWYKPADKESVIIVPAIARGASMKSLGSTSITSTGSERAPNADPDSMANTNVAPRNISIAKPSICNQTSAEPDVTVVSHSQVVQPVLATPNSSEPMTYFAQVNSESPSSPSTCHPAELTISIPVSEVDRSNPNKDLDVVSTQSVELALNMKSHQNRSMKTKAIPSNWEERVPGLVTVSPLPAYSEISEKKSKSSVTTTKKGSNLGTHKGPRHELKVVTNRPIELHGCHRSDVENFSRGLSARLRASRNRKLTPDGKENVLVSTGSTNAAF
ncbi:hypothetical protein EV359DRAFT_79849 [Lentinula novae-zelandiae]|nr:hypothetical protein EV359DRAFT_79849 [Lentinula novae-zelandiae]